MASILRSYLVKGIENLIGFRSNTVDKRVQWHFVFVALWIFILTVASYDIWVTNELKYDVLLVEANPFTHYIINTTGSLSSVLALRCWTVGVGSLLCVMAYQRYRTLAWFGTTFLAIVHLYMYFSLKITYNLLTYGTLWG